MYDDFRGKDPIILQPGDNDVPYTFTFKPSSNSTANSGSIPYGTTISSVAVKVYNELGSTVTGEIVSSESNSSLVETISLKYPATAGPGRYSVEMLLTLSSSAVMEFDFTRVYALDKEAKR